MRKTIKRFITYVACMAVCLTAIPLRQVNAESQTPSVSVSKTTVSAGNYFFTYLSAKDFVNLSALKLTIRYDASVVEYNSKYLYDLLEGSISDVDANTPGEIHISIMNYEGISGDGNLLGLQFRAMSASPAGNYFLKISVEEAYDIDLNSVSLEKENGEVVIQEAIQTAQQISFLGRCSPGEVSYEDSVVYSISRGYGSDLAAGIFIVLYDAEMLRLENVAMGDLLDNSDGMYDVNDNGKGSVRIVFMSDKNIYSSGYGSELFQLKFTVKKNCSGTTKITTTPSSLYKTNFDSLVADSFDSSVNLEEKGVEEAVTDEMSLQLLEEVSEGVFTIDTVLHSLKGIAAGDFSIQYNKNDVKCTNVIIDDCISDTGSYLVTKEKIDNGEVLFSFVNAKGLEGDYTILHLEFEVVNSRVDSTVISINGNDVVGVADEIRVKFNPVTVNMVTPAPIPLPSETPQTTPEVTGPTPSVVPVVTSTPEAVIPTRKLDNPIKTQNSSIKIKKVVIKKIINKKNRKLQITLKKLKNISGFQCYYSTKKNFKEKKIVILRKDKFTLKKLSRKTYYIKIRAFRKGKNGLKRYGKWSKITKVKVKK